MDTRLNGKFSVEVGEELTVSSPQSKDCGSTYNYLRRSIPEIH